MLNMHNEALKKKKKKKDFFVISLFHFSSE
jgi:hypothetical protein